MQLWFLLSVVSLSVKVEESGEFGAKEWCARGVTCQKGDRCFLCHFFQTTRREKMLQNHSTLLRMMETGRYLNVLLASSGVT